MTRNSIERLADCAPWIDDTPAMIKAHAAIEARASRTAVGVVKHRARVYLYQPRQLDFLGWHVGFFAQGSLMTARQLISFASAILNLEIRQARYDFIPAKIIDARAAILAGRYMRAHQDR